MNLYRVRICVYLWCNCTIINNTKHWHLLFLSKVFTEVDTYKCLTSGLLLFNTYFSIVYHLYHVTYYLLDLSCLFFNVACFEIIWLILEFKNNQHWWRVYAVPCWFIILFNRCLCFLLAQCIGFHRNCPNVAVVVFALTFCIERVRHRHRSV